jgi:transcription factor E2F7/8
LERLSIGFVLIFKKKSIVTLEDAARMISPENTDELKIKTQVIFKLKIRRLYDIANVFKSLGLI